jgi:hypothetical protein
MGTAGVYEYVDNPEKPGEKKFQINAINCIVSGSLRII